MSRYVDIDKHVYVRYIDERSNEIVISLNTIAEILENTVGLFPIEDTVIEVVRCKDCKHWEQDVIFGDAYCRGKRQLNPNWFCADGERRNDEKIH